MSIWLQSASEEQVHIDSRLEESSSLLVSKLTIPLENITEKMGETIRKHGGVHVQATGQNYNLILSLNKNREELGISDIKLHRPNNRNIPAGAINSTAIEPDDKEMDYPPSLGGRRSLREVDLITFRMPQDRFDCSKPGEETNLAEIEHHPAWPAMSFFPVTDKLHAMRLISLIGDPRWYIDIDRPDSTKNLLNAFGLGRDGHQNVEAYLTGKGSGKNFPHCCSVIKTYDQGLLSHLDDAVPWMLAEARRYLRIVCASWLDNLTEQREYVYSQLMDGKKPQPVRAQMTPSEAYSPQLFVPQYEFPEPILFDWDKHIKKWQERRAGING
jgi:hypothetical protein